MHDDLTPRRRGIVLPVCLSLMFAMLLLALGLAQQSRAHLGFAMMLEAETREREAAFAAMADLTSILQYMADPTLFQKELKPDLMGLPDTLGTSTAETPFHNGSDIDVRIDGQFNGSSKDSSLYRAPSKTLDTADGYGSVKTTTGCIPVPARHAALVVQGTLPGTGLTTWAAVVSANHPFGLLTPQGAITILTARTTGDYTGGSETGLLANLFAARGITAGSRVYARMYAPAGTQVQVPSGISAPLASCAIPTDLDVSLATAKANVITGLTDKGPDIVQLQKSRHQSFPDTNEVTEACQSGQVVTQYNPGNSDVSTVLGVQGTDLSGDTFQVASADFVVPSGRAIQVPYKMDIQGNLVLMSSSVLSVTQELKVHGNLYLAQQTSLVVGGKLTVDGRIDMVYKPGTNPSITSSVLVSGDVQISTGMASHEEGLQTTSRDPFQKPDCPFPPSTLTCMIPGRPPQIHTEQVHNPNCDKFDLQAAQAVQVNNGAFSAFFPTVKLMGAQSLDNIAGVFICADGTITVGGSSSDKAAGFLLANGGINLSVGRFTGVAWSRTGGINASTTNWQWFPYWSHAWVHTASGDTAVVANRYWRTGFGRLP